MLCPNCKKELSFGVQFCSECGMNLNAPIKKQKKSVTKKWWFWVIVAIAVIAFIGIAGGGDSADTPADSDNVVEQNDAETTTKAQETTTEKITEATTVVQSLSEDEYKSVCQSVSYKDIARMPDDYVGMDVVFSGEVIQVMESSWSDTITYRINVTKDEYGFWEDTVYVTYVLPEGAPRILEDDIVKFYGICQGTYTYESVMGSNVTIPSVDALYIDIH